MMMIDDDDDDDDDDDYDYDYNMICVVERRTVEGITPHITK